MAGNTRGDALTRTGQERGAESGGYIVTRSIWNPFASPEIEFDPESDLGSPTPSPPPLTAEERAEHQRRTAILIDQLSAAANSEARLNLMFETDDPYNPDIKPTDQEWIKKREEVLALIAAEVRVLEVLEKLDFKAHNFKGLQLFPPPSEGLALKLQTESTVAYKAALGPGGAFEGVKDNFITKLTMLHFGLPIEPLTENNVLNCEKDENDDPDGEPRTPGITKIFYSEKPLQFLDFYHERSYGLPIIRRPKPMSQNIHQPDVSQTQLPEGQDVDGHGPGRHNPHHPMQPTGDPVGMRGGGGISSYRYLYSAYGANIRLRATDNEVSADDFREAALKALDLDPNSAWTIVVDQFDNSERFKATPIKPFLRSFTVPHFKFEDIYESYLKARISNRLEDWPLSVDYYGAARTESGRPPRPFSIPARGPNGKDSLDLSLLPELPSWPSPTSERATAKLHAYPGSASEPFEDEAEHFTNAIRKLFPTVKRDLSVSLYSPQLDKTAKGTGAAFRHTMVFPLESNFQQYKDIRSRTSQGTGWIIVAHERTTVAPRSWPPIVSSGGPTDEQLQHPQFIIPPPPPPPPSDTPDPDYIYGYGGKVLVEKNADSFQAGALALLGLANVDGWTFVVDVCEGNAQTHTLSASNLRNRFEKYIKNAVGDRETYPWPIFVRKCTRVPGKDLAPPASLPEYAILRGPDRQSYWKLPSPIDGRYGLNQIQDGFYAAMLVHYPLGSPRPSENVDFNTDLGYGGIELTQEFWKNVIEHYHSKSSEKALTYWSIFPPRADPAGEVGIRLAGTPRYLTFPRGDFDALAEALRKLSHAVIFDKARNPTSSKPSSFRIWFTAEDREDNVGSSTFDYDDNDSSSMNLADRLRGFFQSAETIKSTTCIWFRPEWKQFALVENRPSDYVGMEVDPRMETWDLEATGDSSLGSFIYALTMLFGEEGSSQTEGVEIFIPQANQRFVINKSTTDAEWRKHVFDYFHDNTLFVKSSSSAIYCHYDTSEPWGVLDMPTSRNPATTLVPHIPQPSPLMSARIPRSSSSTEDAHRHQNRHQDMDRGNGGMPPPVVQPPREPRPIPAAKPPVFRTSEVTKFNKWMLNEKAKDALKLRSWTQDHSVIEPGYAPAAPLTGESLELAITGGSSMPTLFAQPLTPTDIIQLRKENRKLLNHALEREIGCPICDTTFKPYDNEAKTKHYQSHMEQLSSVGNCPVCSERWALFTISQKKDHLIADFAKRDNEDITRFWEDTRCPICNMDFRYKSADDVTVHIASHVPGALKFCDRCGLDMLACTPAEKGHHDRVCTRKTPVREPGAPKPILCAYCGRERTPASERRREHDVCGNGQFCVRDGYDLTYLGVQEKQEHLRRCRSPGGPTGRYCKRCGKELAALSTQGLASHNDECYSREPVASAGDSHSANGPGKAVEAQRIKNAAEKAELLRRQTELRAQEIAVLVREREIRERERDLDLQHGKRNEGLPACHSDALNASLTEFKRRLPEFREAHAMIRDFAANLGKSKQPTPKTQATAKERAIISKAENLIRIKRATEAQTQKLAADAIREREKALISLRAEQGDAELKYPQIRGRPLNPHVTEARAKVQEAIDAIDAAKQTESERKLQAEVTLGLLEAEFAARKIAIASVPSASAPVNPGGTSGGSGGGGRGGRGGRGGKGGGGRGAAGGGDNGEKGGSGGSPGNVPGEDGVDQTGFLPSPPAPSSKKLPTPRRARSVRGRAPTTGSKRKKASMDDAEDTMSGNFVNLVRSPSKRETKKMRMAGGLRQRLAIAEEGEGEGGSLFDGAGAGAGGAGPMSPVPRRATRTAAATRKVGRPRKAVQEGVEENDDGFEDVDEEEEEEEGEEGEMSARNVPRRARN